MNGGPMPPDPTAPPHWFLIVVVLFGAMLLAFVLLFLIGTLEQRKQKRLDAAEALAQAVAHEKEDLENFKIQSLINQSPGGRKPWQ